MGSLTNTSAMSALQVMRNIDRDLATTQNRISTGLRVASAADNASYWSIATTMRSDNQALATVADSLGLSSAKTDVAYAGLNASIDIITAISTKLVAAREPGADRDKINTEITQLKSQLLTTAQSSSFSKENWLYNTSTAALGTRQMVGSFRRNEDGTVSTSTIDFNTANSVLIDTNTASRGLLTRATVGTLPSGTTTTTANYYLVTIPGAAGVVGAEIKISATTSTNTLDGMISATNAILQNLTTGAATLGAVSSRISQQSNFIRTLSDIITKGVGRMVDADMNEESTRLKALQTQQQLAIQALAISNTSAQNVLALFR